MALGGSPWVPMRLVIQLHILPTRKKQRYQKVQLMEKPCGPGFFLTPRKNSSNFSKKPWHLFFSGGIFQAILGGFQLQNNFGGVCFLVSKFPSSLVHPSFTPPKTNMTMETQPFEDVFPIENREFPVSHVSELRGASQFVFQSTPPPVSG